LAFAASTLVTLVYFLFGTPSSTSDSFITNLVTVNSILIAAVGLLAPFIAEGSRFLRFVKEVEKSYWNSPNPIDKAFKAAIHRRNVTYLMLIPFLAVFPFFVSVMLALGAMVSLGMARSLLAGTAFWLMLGTFTSIMFALWKLTLSQRRNIV
jgi:hypothetical protein